MARSAAEVLLHPVRLRIALAMGGEELTTADVAGHLPDVPTATLYRHIAILTEAGMLEVVAERRVRGSVERTYRLVSEAARLGPDDAAAMTREQHERGFVMFAAALIDAFGRYVADPSSVPGVDTVGYRQIALWLDAAESEEMASELRDVLGRYEANGPSAERTRMMLSNILIPDLVETRRERD